MNTSKVQQGQVNEATEEADVEEAKRVETKNQTENEGRNGSLSSRNISVAELRGHILKGLSAIRYQLGNDSNFSSLHIELASFESGSQGFFERLHKWFDDNVVKADQHPWNHKKHPFKTVKNSYHCQKPTDLRVWTRRRRDTCKYYRNEFKNEVCPGTSEEKLDKLFGAHWLDGCSGLVPLPFHNIVTPACMSHDICYGCGGGKPEKGRVWCDMQFAKTIATECARKISILRIPERATCLGWAGLIGSGVYFFAEDYYHPNFEGWGCDNSCAKDVYTYGEAHLRNLDPWFMHVR
jgi:hypothetical protein